MSTQKAKFKKRTCSCPSLWCSSCREGGSGGRARPVTEITGITDASDDAIVLPGDVLNVKVKKLCNTRFFYNSKPVSPKVDTLLARKSQNWKNWVQILLDHEFSVAFVSLVCIFFHKQHQSVLPALMLVSQCPMHTTMTSATPMSTPSEALATLR